MTSFQFAFAIHFFLCGGTRRGMYIISFNVKGFSFLHAFFFFSLKFPCHICFHESKTAVFISSWCDVMSSTLSYTLNEEKVDNPVSSREE